MCCWATVSLNRVRSAVSKSEISSSYGDREIGTLDGQVSRKWITTLWLNDLSSIDFEEIA